MNRHAYWLLLLLLLLAGASCCCYWLLLADAHQQPAWLLLVAVGCCMLLTVAECHFSAIFCEFGEFGKNRQNQVGGGGAEKPSWGGVC
jgi:hypothetical protein